jgi:hypothetical protein
VVVNGYGSATGAYGISIESIGSLTPANTDERTRNPLTRVRGSRHSPTIEK